jgi:hypothetical protein
MPPPYLHPSSPDSGLAGNYRGKAQTSGRPKSTRRKAELAMRESHCHSKSRWSRGPNRQAGQSIKPHFISVFHYAARQVPQTGFYFGSRLRAIESSMPLRKLIDSGAE